MRHRHHWETGKFGGPAAFGLAAFGLFALAAASAQAQVAPSSVTPSDLRPASNGSAVIALPASPGLVPPGNAGNLAVTLSGVSVQGGFDELADEQRRITEGVVGKRVTVADIYAAASELERAYGAAGYALVRVVVPPQRLDPHGRLKLVVVDGYIESVDTKGVPARQQGVVASRLAALVGKRHVKLTELERRVLLAGDIQGIVVKSTLTSGAESGGAKLVLEAPHESLISGNSTFDNNLPRSLNNWETTRNLSINSPFGYGEQFYLTATTGYDIMKLFDGTIPLQIFGGGFVMPVGTDGFTINPEYTNAITRPIPQAGAPAVTGYFQRADLRASYPLIRTRKETLTLSSTLEWDQEYMRPNGFPIDLYSDNYFVWRGKADSLTSLNNGSTLDVTGTLSQGLGGRTGFGSIVPLSQQGATPHFTKLYADARWTQVFPEMFSVSLYGAGQTSFGQPLMISEQLSLDGPGAVSGYPTGTFVVDEGLLGRAEFGKTFLFPAWGGTQIPVEPYIFGAAAIGVIDQPTAVQMGTLHVGSLGVGARVSATATGEIAKFISNGNLAVELARYASDVPGERQGWRGNLSVSLGF